MRKLLAKGHEPANLDVFILLQVCLLIKSAFLVKRTPIAERAGSNYCCCSLVTKSCPTICDPMDCSPTGSSVHGILRQEHWSGLPFPSPGDLPNPGIEPTSPALQTDCLPLSHLEAGEVTANGEDAQCPQQATLPNPKRDLGPAQMSPVLCVCVLNVDLSCVLFLH